MGVVGEEDVVGAAHVRLVVIDEAARVSVDVYRAVVPILALTGRADGVLVDAVWKARLLL